MPCIVNRYVLKVAIRFVLVVALVCIDNLICTCKYLRLWFRKRGRASLSREQMKSGDGVAVDVSFLTNVSLVMYSSLLMFVQCFPTCM